MSKKDKQGQYESIISRIFLNHYKAGMREFEFDRTEIELVADELGVMLPKNKGDLIYSYRYRKELPGSIALTAKAGFEWIIEGAGLARYRFKQSRIVKIAPTPDLVTIKIPDATPEIISAYALTDEQALLAKVRYNRLIDIFLGVTSFSLQSHLRTTVTNIGQIEIDEVYVGVDGDGRQFIVPVQAKGGKDRHGVVQTLQDVACCEEKFPDLTCRAVSAQFMDGERIAMFELALKKGEIQIVAEKHYQLVSHKDISSKDLRSYSKGR